MPRYRVTARMWIADRIVEPGQTITVSNPLPGADQATHFYELKDEPDAAADVAKQPAA